MPDAAQEGFMSVFLRLNIEKVEYFNISMFEV